MILEQFYPKEWLESVYIIDWEARQKQGLCGVIFDVDNTLVPHGAPANEQAVALFRHLHGLGIKTCLLSNNKESRVRAFARQVNSPYIHKAGKPGVKNYMRAMEIMGTQRRTTLFVGDQLFTDVYGANRCGIHGILVNPIHPKEEIQIVLKRYLEVIVLHFYKKRRKETDR